MGGEIKNDMSGQSRYALWVHNVKIQKSLIRHKEGAF